MYCTNFIFNNNASDCVKIYESEISRIFQSLFPTKIRIFNHDKSKRWFTPKLQLLKKKKRKAERIYRKFPNNDVYLENYRKSRNSYTIAIRQARINYFSQKITLLKGDPKSLSNVLKDLSGNKKEKILPSKGEVSKIAENMSIFYVDKVKNIRTKISNETKISLNNANSLLYIKHHNTKTFSDFELLSITDIVRIAGKV